MPPCQTRTEGDKIEVKPTESGNVLRANCPRCGHDVVFWRSQGACRDGCGHLLEIVSGTETLFVFRKE